MNRAYDHQNLSGAHDRLDAHRVRLLGHFLHRLEKTGVGFYGAFRQVYTVRFLGEYHIWLIKADMSVVSKTDNIRKKLTIYS